MSDLTLKRQISSSFAGACVTSLTMTPLDVIKVRLQIQNRPNPLQKGDKLMCFNGIMDCVCTVENGPKPNEPMEKYFKRCWYYRPNHFNSGVDAFGKILRNEGLGSLWSGLTPTVAQSTISVCFYFTLYEHLKGQLLKIDPQNQSLNNYFYIPLAGVTARTATCVLVNPIEIIRVRMQADPNQSYSHQVKSVLKDRSSWGRGLLMSIYRDAPFSAIYWMINELIRSNLSDPERSWLGPRKSNSGSGPSLGLLGPEATIALSKNSFSKSFIAGAIAGSIAALATHPFDVIKTRIQTEKKTALGQSSISQVRNFYRQQGISGLYAGWRQRCLRTSLACALMLGTYEFTKDYFDRKFGKPR